MKSFPWLNPIVALITNLLSGLARGRRLRAWIGVSFWLGLLLPLALTVQAQDPALPLPPSVPPSIDTSDLVPALGTSEPAIPGQPQPPVDQPEWVNPLQDSLEDLPTATQPTQPSVETLDTSVGREIIIEQTGVIQRETGITIEPEEGILSEEEIPVVFLERSTGKRIRVIPGVGLEIYDPSAQPPPAPPPAPIDPSGPLPAPGDEDLLYPLPLAVPITSGFGWRTHPLTGNREFHQGVDLGATMGTPVLAAFSGTVLMAGPSGGLGNTVHLSHNDNLRTRYGHLSSVAVANGETVSQGSIIGYVGSTGLSTGPHLHFELWRQLPGSGWTALDSADQLKVAVAQLAP